MLYYNQDLPDLTPYQQNFVGANSFYSKLYYSIFRFRKYGNETL